MGKIIFMAIKRSFLNWGMIASVVIFSLILMFILGEAIGGMQETGIVEKERVILLIEEGSLDMGIQDLLTILEQDGLVTVKGLRDYQESKDQILKGSLDTMIVQKSINGVEHIDLYTIHPKSPIHGVLESYVDKSVAIIELGQMGIDYQVNDLSNMYQRIKGAGAPMGIDYYAVQALLQILVFGGLFGMFSVMEEKDQNLWVRYRLITLPRWKVMAGRAIANTGFLWVMSIAVVASSYLLYDTNWGTKLWLVMLSLLIHCAIVIGIAMLVSLITKSTSATAGIVVILLILFSNASGAFGFDSKEGIGVLLSPNYHAKNLIYISIYGGSARALLEAFAGQFIILIVVYASMFGYIWDHERKVTKWL